MKALLLLLLSVALAHAGSITTGQNALSTTAEIVAAATGIQGAGTRISLKIKNNDASISVYIGPADTVTSANGFLLKAGESVEIRSNAAVYAIAASGTPTISIISELH